MKHLFCNGRVLTVSEPMPVLPRIEAPDDATPIGCCIDAVVPDEDAREAARMALRRGGKRKVLTK